jgi:hypothetical protein
MDAPKRIWVVEGFADVGRGAWDSVEMGDDTEYILATEHARIVAEKDARLERYELALLDIAGGASDPWIVAGAALKGDDNG